MSFKQVLVSLSAIAMLGASPFASAQCNYDDSSKFEGWGWNSITQESCPPVTVQSNCEDRGDYPWGWNTETLSSCRLDSQPSGSGSAVQLVPATDVYNNYSAPLLPFEQQQTAILSTHSRVHLYKLRLETAMALQVNVLVGAELQGAIGTLYKGSHSGSLQIDEPARCFPSGYYTLILGKLTADVEVPYTISVSATDKQCVERIASVVNNEHPDGDWYVRMIQMENNYGARGSSTQQEPLTD